MITLTSVNRFAGIVSLTSTVSPSGLTVLLNPTSLALQPGGSATSTLDVPFLVPLGIYSITITGSSGTVSHSVVVTAIVTGADYAIAASPTSVTVLAGAPGSSTITVVGLNACSGTVSLTASTSPTGLACSLAPTSIVLGTAQTSALSCSSSIAQTYTVTVTATTGPLTHAASVTFAVTDFTLTANPVSVTVSPGVPGTSTVTVTSVNGFSGNVTLNTAVSPSPGLTASLNPSSVTMSGSALLVMTETTIGNYTVTVTGTSGPLNHFLTVTARIVLPNLPPPEFTQSNWKHRLSLSKNNNFQTWNVAIKNMSGNTTIYAMIVINGVDGSGAESFTLTSSILNLGPNKSTTNIQLTKMFTNAEIGETFVFNMLISWGTTPNALIFQSTANQGIRTSGSFTIFL